MSFKSASLAILLVFVTGYHVIASTPIHKLSENDSIERKPTTPLHSMATLLTLSSVSPTANSISAAVSSAIELTFSEDMDGTTVNSTTIKISGSQTGMISGSFSVSNKVVTFTPTASFRAGEKVTVTITTNVKSTSQESLAASFSYSFSTKTEPAPAQPAEFALHGIGSDLSFIYAISAVDLDGDGNLDLIVSGADDEDIPLLAWFKNDGSQNFTQYSITTDLQWIGSISVADLDGDGDLDIIVGGYGGDSPLVWYENDGSQNFTQHSITIDIPYINSISVADLDGDGHLDLIIGGADDNYNPFLAWYENDGSQSFTQHSITTNLQWINSISAVNLDGDGDLDIIAGGGGNGPLVWFENDGSQGFTQHSIDSDIPSINSISAVDLDGDGDLDLIVGGHGGNNPLAWYENDGSQGFTQHSIVTDLPYIYSISAADLDGDGDLDLIVGGEGGSNLLAWYENDGSQSFTQHSIVTDLPYIYSISAADLDGDGDLALLSVGKVGVTF